MADFDFLRQKMMQKMALRQQLAQIFFSTVDLQFVDVLTLI